MKTKANKRIDTKDRNGQINGYLLPIYNINENFHEPGKAPQQVYLTVIKGRMIKGPHLHFIRNGFFTCIQGNVRIILKKDQTYQTYYSGESYNYQSIIIPSGTPAAIQNLSEKDAYLLNMPYPAWTPDMDDEHTADFSDFNFNENNITMKVKARVMICNDRFIMRTIEQQDIEILRKWKNLHKEHFFFKNELTQEEQKKWYKQLSQKVDDHMFIIKEGNKPVGCIGARLFEEYIDIYNVILGDKSYQGQHVMKNAILAIISFANLMYNGKPAKVRVLLSNPAINWYEKVGFIKIDYYSDYVLMQFNSPQVKDNLNYQFEITSQLNSK